MNAVPWGGGSLLTDVPGYAVNNPLYRGPSLIHGWLPWTIQIVAALLLLLAVARRQRRWLRVWIPVAAVTGAVAGCIAAWWVSSQGMADNPPPLALWIWIGAAAGALVVLAAGWARSRWWRRGASILAVPLCLLAAAVVLNLWVDYFDTVRLAWAAITAGPLPDETDMTTVENLKGRGATDTGRVVPIDTGDDISGFHHRSEYVYLPPAWFAAPAPPRLPALVMISGAWSTPADWSRQGNAVSFADDFARAHNGMAPILVFVDTGGNFNNDTECVNGPRGNVADHITKEVVPQVISDFGTSADPANWGVVGWSMGGTCAVDLTITHPELFHTFVDMAGDLTPNAGTKEQTVERLFGGDEKAWRGFDTLTVMQDHGRYQGISGWFDVSSTAKIKAGQEHNTGPEAARQLCHAGASVGIECAVVTRTGNHDWAYAQAVLAEAFPWIAGQVGTPGVPRTPLPPGHPA